MILYIYIYLFIYVQEFQVIHVFFVLVFCVEHSRSIPASQKTWSLEIRPVLVKTHPFGGPSCPNLPIPKSLVESSKFPARGWANLELLSCFWGPRKGTHSIMSYSQPPSIRASICAWIHIKYLCINIYIYMCVCASQLRYDFKGDISLLSLILSHLFPNLFHSVSQAHILSQAYFHCISTWESHRCTWPLSPITCTVSLSPTLKACKKWNAHEAVPVS